MRYKKEVLNSNTIAVALILLLFFLVLGLKPTGRATIDDEIPWDFQDEFNTIDLDTWEALSGPVGGVSAKGDGSIVLGDRTYVSYTMSEMPVADISRTLWEVSLKVVKGTHPNEGCFKCPDVNVDGSINIQDMVAVSAKSGLRESDSGYVSSYDVTSDGIINTSDTQCVATDFGKSPDNYASCTSTTSSALLGTIIPSSLTGYTEIQIYEDKIVAYCTTTNSNSYPLDMTNYHTLGIGFDNTGDAYLVIDQDWDNKKTIPRCSGNNGNPSIRFYEPSKKGYALQLDYYYIYYSYTATCEPNWDCGEWSECSTSGRQTRICVELEGCQDGEKAEFQPCVPTPIFPTTPTPPPAPGGNQSGDNITPTQGLQVIQPGQVAETAQLQEGDAACSQACEGQGFKGGLCGSQQDLATLGPYRTCQNDEVVQSFCRSAGYFGVKTTSEAQCDLGNECYCINLNCCTGGCGADGLCRGDTIVSGLPQIYGSDVSDLVEGTEVPIQRGIGSLTCGGCLIEGECINVGEAFYYGEDPVYCKERRQLIYLDTETFCISNSDCLDGTCEDYGCVDSGGEKRRNIFLRIIDAIREVFTSE